jgi:HEAT repeat protein
MVRKLVYFMALLFPMGALTGCRSEEATPNPDAWIVAMKERLQEHRRLSLERMKTLPKNLAYFSGENPTRWQEGADRLRALEQKEKGFLYDRIRELLTAGVRRGGAGAAAREELVRMGEIIALTALYESRDRAKWISATAALKAKGRQGIGAAAVKLIQKFISENALDIAMAREGLVLLGPGSIRFLVEALRSERVRQTVRQRCVDVLVSFGEQAVEPMLVCMKDSRSRVRYIGILALGQIGGPRAVQALREALERESQPLVTCAMLQALGKMGNPEVAPAVRAKLGSEDLSVVKFAARAVKALGDKEAVPALIEALARVQRNVAARVRSEVLDALRTLSGRNFGPEPGPWRDWLEKKR